MNVAWCTLLFRRERPFSHCSTPLKPLASVKSAPSRQNTSNPTVFFSHFQAIIRVWKTGHETRIPLPPVFTQRRTLKYVGFFFFYEDASGHTRTSRLLFSTLIKALKKNPQTSSRASANKHINTHTPDCCWGGNKSCDRKAKPWSYTAASSLYIFFWLQEGGRGEFRMDKIGLRSLRVM